jgi:hypothetical protein
MLGPSQCGDDWQGPPSPTRSPRCLPVDPALDHMDSVDRSLNNTTSPRRSRSLSTFSITDIDSHCNPHQHRNANPSTSSIHDTPQQTLRRKKRMILHSPNITPQHSETNLVRTAYSTPEPHSGHFFPLGHPSRPYYSAIRKNMSRPSSPFDNNTSNSLRSFSPLPYSHSSLPNDSFQDDYSAFHTPPTSSRLFSSSVTGFSLSGETEMRIALARQQVRNSPDELTDYKFHDTRKTGKGRLRRVVKKMSRGFKHFMFGITVKLL